MHKSLTGREKVKGKDGRKTRATESLDDAPKWLLITHMSYGSCVTNYELLE